MQACAHTLGSSNCQILPRPPLKAFSAIFLRSFFLPCKNKGMIIPTVPFVIILFQCLRNIHLFLRPDRGFPLARYSSASSCDSWLRLPPVASRVSPGWPTWPPAVITRNLVCPPLITNSRLIANAQVSITLNLTCAKQSLKTLIPVDLALQL